MTPKDWKKMEQVNRELIAEAELRSEVRAHEESAITSEDLSAIQEKLREIRRADNIEFCTYILLFAAVAFFLIIILQSIGHR